MRRQRRDDYQADHGLLSGARRASMSRIRMATSSASAIAPPQANNGLDVVRVRNKLRRLSSVGTRITDLTFHRLATQSISLLVAVEKQKMLSNIAPRFFNVQLDVNID